MKSAKNVYPLSPFLVGGKKNIYQLPPASAGGEVIESFIGLLLACF